MTEITKVMGLALVNAMWEPIDENDGGRVIKSDGKFRVYEKTSDGTERIGVYESESVAMDVFKELTEHD